MEARCSAFQPRVEGARRRLEAARRDVPRADGLRIAETLQAHETGLAKYPDDGVLRLSTNPGRARLAPDRGPSRACARCDQELMEALPCGRRGAFYGSPERQKAYWPARKAACKAARRGG